MNRFRIKIASESGAGLLSTGDILINAFKDLGFYVVADREYPSLIKGGHSCYNINISNEKINSLYSEADILIAIDKSAFRFYLNDIKENGVLMHAYDKTDGLADFIKNISTKNIQILSLKGRELAEQVGASILMINVILAGMFWKYMNLPYDVLEKELTRQFKDKPKLLDLDLKCAKKAYDEMECGIDLMGSLRIEPNVNNELTLMDGNKALALGAMHAGCRIYYAYPMSPSSTILTYMSEFACHTNMIVKQVEDEISVVNMALGSMNMGTRALAATSGGGFDLMTETVSLAGMIESPLLIIVAQRPGPATGLPTWTAQSDLNLAIHSAHGEFPKIVMSVSSAEDAFYLIQHAFNLTEEFQTPVILLTEKNIAESLVSIEKFKMNTIQIKRGISDPAKIMDNKRYKITTNGLSERWIPCSNEHYYFANGDEHFEEGALTEEADECFKMYDKRMKKLALIEDNLPEPEVFGEKNADISFIGWGSSKSVIMDAMNLFSKRGVKINYLHYSYLYPLKTQILDKFFEENKNIHALELNYTGQFAEIIESKTKHTFKGKFLKSNGRPFFMEDMEQYIVKNIDNNLDI